MILQTPDGTHIPTVTTDDMRLVDDLMDKIYGIELLQMMENAGRNLADLAETMLQKNAFGKKTTISVLVGPGGNGGGGLVAARHLHNRGHRVSVFSPVSLADYTLVTKHQANSIIAMGIPVSSTVTFADSDLILDCLIGYSLTGDPRGEFANMITVANETGLPILSLDTPSGLDTTSGVVHTPCISATVTMTLALPKCGFLTKTAAPCLGSVYVADISVPPSLYKTYLQMEVPSTLFTETRIVPLLLV
jgi:NAD(P)H-hydrate epimerase